MVGCLHQNGFLAGAVENAIILIKLDTSQTTLCRWH